MAENDYAKMFTIDDLKRAMVEVKKICQQRTQCDGCPFDRPCASTCPMNYLPCDWMIDDWKEHTEWHKDRGKSGE